jgi:hypothetical protein
MSLLSGCGKKGWTADTLPWVGADPVLFKDDFSKENSGWSISEDALSFSGYEEGKFRLWVDVPDYQIWSVPGLNFKNSHIATRAEKRSGPDNNFFGVLCRYQDEFNYYSFVISSDGYFGAYKVVDGEKSLITQQSMEFSEVINRGNATNDIQAVCNGNNFLFIVNEKQLVEMQDDCLTYGDVGLIAGNLAENGVDILFDHFIVIKP